MHPINLPRSTLDEDIPLRATNLSGENDNAIQFVVPQFFFENYLSSFFSTHLTSHFCSPSHFILLFSLLPSSKYFNLFTVSFITLFLNFLQLFSCKPVASRP